MGLNNKGFFFTMDSILAGGIILVVILLSSSSYVNKQPSIHLNYLSQDLVRTLSAITVEEIDNEYLDSLVGTEITNIQNTVLEQISEFWADDKMVFASNSVQSVIEPLLPNSVGFGVWIDNELIYEREDIPLTKSLVSSKIIVSGVETTLETRKYPPTLLGPVVFEVRVWQ